MKNYAILVIKAILAGLMIAVGGMIYLISENKFIGSMLFTFGLFTIYTFDLALYTGKVGYLFEKKNPLEILLVWLGNFVGAVGSGVLILQTRLVTKTALVHHAEEYSHLKLGDTYVSIFILGILCGLLMYIAAEAFKRDQNTPNSVGGYIGLFLCVMLFLLAGFEHSIANMFYFTVAKSWSFHTLICLIVVSLGNAVGGVLLNVSAMAIKRLKSA